MDVIKTLIFLFLPLLVSCTPDPPKNTSFQKSSIPNCDEQVIPGEYIVRWKSGRITVEHGKNDTHFISNFLETHKDKIKMAEPHYRMKISEGTRVEQKDWGGTLNWGVDKVDAQAAWNQNYDGQGVIVAIIDSGMDTTHPELKDLLAVNPNEEINGIDDDDNGKVDDYYGYDFAARSGEVIDYTGHGTHVAGIIAASHSVGKVKGAAPGVKILPLTFIEADGAGSVGAALAAINYSVERGAKVINASWGGEGCSLALRDEIKALAKFDILFISASGNSGRNLDDFPEYPAAFTIDNQIAVGASTYDDKTAGFSNYGNFVSLVAPGAFIVSTFPKQFDDDGIVDGITPLNGTSMAAPFVTAAAAILWSKNPKATYQEVKSALLAGVNQGPYPVVTRGQLDIARSLELIDEPSEDPTPENP